jgi:hypothetical protein
MSRSAEAGASVYSGRPDPVWSVDDALVQRLQRLWEAAPAVSDAEAGPSPPVLGYRGAFVRLPDGRTWHVFEGVVQVGDERRADRDGEFERTVLASAPPGALPPALR